MVPLAMRNIKCKNLLPPDSAASDALVHLNLTSLSLIRPSSAAIFVLSSVLPPSYFLEIIWLLDKD